MRIHSITKSLHGELPFIGKPTTILRLSGCNMSPPCHYCDTDFKFKTEMSVPDIIDHFNSQNITDVLITGGEPMMQESEVVKLLMDDVLDINYTLETNGTFDVEPVLGGCTTVVDYKLGVKDYEFCENNFKTADYIKCVFATPKQFNDYITIAEKYIDYNDPVFVFSPVWELYHSDPWMVKKYAKHIIESQNPNWRFQLQLHKLLNIA